MTETTLLYTFSFRWKKIVAALPKDQTAVKAKDAKREAAAAKKKGKKGDPQTDPKFDPKTMKAVDVRGCLNLTLTLILTLTLTLNP
jgi:hypothetical protein